MGKEGRKSLNTKEHDLLLATLRDAREAVGLSQREVSRRLGFQESVYGAIERGERSLDVVEFVLVARALDREPVELFGRFLNAEKSNPA